MDNVIKKKRLDHLDYAKGIGILLVILAHMNLIAGKEDILFTNIIRVIYSFHMPLFFFIGGMNMARKYDGGKLVDTADIRKMAVGLMKPYFIWSFIYMAIRTVIHFRALKLPTERLIATFTFRGIAPLWFLAALFFAQLIFILLRYRWRINVYVIMAFSALMSVILSYAYRSVPDGVHYIIRYCIVTLFRMFPAVFFVSFGNVLNVLFGEKRKYNIVIFAAAVMGFAALNIFVPVKVNMHLFDIKAPMAFLATGVLGSVALMGICTYIPKGIGFLSGLGRRSLDLMVLHYPPIPTVDICFRSISKVVKSRSLAIFFTFVATVVITYILSIILNKIKKLIWRERS